MHFPERLTEQVDKVRDLTAEAVASDSGSVLREVGRLARRVDRVESALLERLDDLGASFERTEERVADLRAESLATTWPRRLFWLMVGATAGAAATYLADPDRGDVRRHEIKDQATARARELTEEVKHRTVDVRDQVAASASRVAQQARGAAHDVADEVRDAAGEVADEARDAARDVADEVQGAR